MNEDSQLAWFCIRSQPKHEHIAAARLREQKINAFSPRIRFKRATRRGPSWVTEALFPGYLFAQFDWQTSFRKVQHTSGVAGIVHFGEKWPTIPASEISELLKNFSGDEIHVIPHELAPGDSVKIADGAFRGLSAVVSTILPGRERVKILLEFVGRQTAVEIHRDAILPEQSPREKIL
jgi:transcriptional antiterminator RfaH